MARTFPREWFWPVVIGLGVFAWMRSNQGLAPYPGIPYFTNPASGGIPLQMPQYIPCVIDPLTGDCVMQESPIPGTPLPGVPNVNPATLPVGGGELIPIIAMPSGGGGSLPVVSGAPGTPGGPLAI